MEISEPIGTNMIQERLETDQYAAPSEFVADLKLMFSNAIQFNRKAADAWKARAEDGDEVANKVFDVATHLLDYVEHLELEYGPAASKPSLSSLRGIATSAAAASPRRPAFCGYTPRALAGTSRRRPISRPRSTRRGTACRATRTAAGVEPRSWRDEARVRLILPRASFLRRGSVPHLGETKLAFG